MSSPSVAAVLVHFRTPHALTRSLAALRDQTLPPTTASVVDNSARLDGTAEMSAMEGCTRFVPPANIGFAAACNLAAANTSSDYLLFVNPDLTLDVEACALLIETAVAHPDAAVVAPRIHGSDGAIELSARRDPGIFDAIVGRRSAVTRLLRGLGLTPRSLMLALGESTEVDWVSGACMLVRRAAFEAVGGFDEGYWMYWEDADLCKRLRQAGWKIRFEPSARGDHTTSSSGTNERTIKAFHASAARFYCKHIARSAVSRRLAAMLLDLRCRLLVHHLRRRRPGREAGR
jgi:N-acetylglucosaminyl-diphospho-decaprenol L-rhamnosyltransferase